jgi:hypothetical protein
LDAIDDFTKAISLEPEDCNNYFERSNCKGAVCDFEGAIADLEEAIRLSKLNNAVNKEYDRLAKAMGQRNGVTAMYEARLAGERLFLAWPDAVKQRFVEMSRSRWQWRR